MSLKNWDRYRQIRELGHGVHGRVVLCQDLQRKRDLEKQQQQQQEQEQVADESAYLVAVKIVSLGGCTDSEQKCALREVAILTQVNHPNVLKFHEYFLDETEALCIVTEFVDGGDLSDLITKMTANQHQQPSQQQQNKTFDEFDDNFYDENTPSVAGTPSPATKLRGKYFVDAIVVADIAEQLLKAVAHLHRNHILHRDIKPANCLISRDGQVKLADFSISRVLTVRAASASQSGSGGSSAARFTPLSLAPEVASGLRPTAAADVWSVGVTLYELYTGEVPFNGLNLLALVARICQGKYDEKLLYARPYSGFVSDSSSNASPSPAAGAVSPSATTGNVSAQVQKEVCNAVCDIVRSALVLNAEERPSASDLLIKFFTEDQDDPAVQQQAAAAAEAVTSDSSCSPDAAAPGAAGTANLLSPERASSRASAAALRDEMLSVVRSSCGSQISSSAQQLECETDHVMIASDSSVAADKSNQKNKTGDDDDAGSSRQGYEDDFEDIEDDILSVSHKSIEVAKQQQQQQQQQQRVVASAKPPTDPAATTKPRQEEKHGDDDNEDDSADNTSDDVEKQINSLPWLKEAELFSHLPVDARNGHDPIFFRAGGGVEVQEDPFMKAAEAMTEQQQTPLGGAAGAPLAAGAGAPLLAVGNNRPNLRYYNNQHLMHRGSVSGLVVEMTPAASSIATSSAARRRSSLTPLGSLTPSTATSLSLRSHLDPSLNSAAASALKQAINAKQADGTSKMIDFATATPEQQQEAIAAAEAAYSDQLKEQIRSRAMMVHRKRLASLAREREDQLIVNEQLQQQQGAAAQPSLPHWNSLPPLPGAPQQPPSSQRQQQQQQQQPKAPPALSATLLGQKRTKADEKRELRELQEKREKSMRPSAVLTDIVDARARGVISGALLSAFPHIWKPHQHHPAAERSEERKRPQQQKPASEKKKKNEYDDDDEEEEELEEEEEEDEIGDDEFKCKIFFSEATAARLQAVPFAGKTADVLQPPATFPAFTISAILNIDAPYKELLAAVQDQVVFFGGTGANASLPALGGTAGGGGTFGGGKTLSASYKILSACVPLQFEWNDSAERGGSGDKISFSRRKDWDMIRDLFFEREGNDDASEVMELNAIPR